MNIILMFPSDCRMAVKLACVCLLLVLFCLSWAKEPTCVTSASSCDECIQLDPECAWCTAPGANIRCHTVNGLRRAGCGKSYIYNPNSRVEVVKNDSSTDPADAKTLFLQPQEFSLHLRPRVSQSFPLTISMPTDQPITELTMNTSNVPAGVDITISSTMKGNRLLVQVNVEAAQCPRTSDSSNQNRTGPWSVYITFKGFPQSVKLEITLLCQCNCTGNREENSAGCSSHGALACGQCECYEHYDGQRCQMDTDSLLSRDDRFCRSDSNAPVCSDRGRCVEGFCHCDIRENPKERYSGRFCECDNFNCFYSNGRLCGGNGKCMCGRCICDDDWTGEDCSCSMETDSCLAKNQILCNGRGMCQCGRCKCEMPYVGPTCENCPLCENRCQEHTVCVECRAFGTETMKNRCDRECGYLTVTMVETKDDLPQRGDTNQFCKMRSRHDDCFFFYTLSSMASGEQATVVRAKQCPRVVQK
ncbi:integrin beta-1-like [Brachyistius frenatus]|uniref:integrin beta-1-like n=1 Tax=Brachyistius frenatus TaxID=100188 RepID=UPI0037E95DF8